MNAKWFVLGIALQQAAAAVAFAWNGQGWRGAFWACLCCANFCTLKF